MPVTHDSMRLIEQVKTVCEHRIYLDEAKELYSLISSKWLHVSQKYVLYRNNCIIFCHTLQQLCVIRHVEFIHFPDIREYWKFTTKSLLKSLIVLRRLNISMEYQVLKKKMRTTEVKQKAKLTPYFKMTEKIAKRTKKMVKKRKKKFRLTHSELSESEEFKDNVWWVCWVMNRILYNFRIYLYLS